MENVEHIDGNLLLAWLSHNGEGSWDAFRRGILSMQGSDSSGTPEESASLMNKLRFRLSDMGCVEFHQENRRRWNVLPPMLASTADNPNRAVLCGARTPALLSKLNETSSRNNLQIERRPQDRLPDWIGVAGEWVDIERTSAIAGVPHVKDLVMQMAARFEPLEIKAAKAQTQRRIIGWEERYFDVRTGRWDPSALARTTIRCTPTYGPSIYLVEVSRTKTIQLPKRDAVYLALAINNRKVLSYDRTRGILSVPTYAPLPDQCSRLACLSAGAYGRVNAGKVEYGPMPEQAARFILAAVGQT